MNKSEFQNSLLHWFEKQQRKLPWRENYSPYEVWISEIMLQQTQVKTVLPFYERWMRELPDIGAVAAAEEDRVLKLWEGLGYYSRAKNLKKAAEIVVAEHQGRVPNSYEVLLKLPGFGPYTAAAVASIAFEEDKAVVDGNVIRVLARVTNFAENPRKNMAFFWNLAQELLPLGHARDFNQGLMELGALVCTPKKPNCSVCPLKSQCEARRLGIQEELPALGASKKLEKIQVAVAILEMDGKVYIQKRPEKGLMPGLWEFPGGKVKPGESVEMTLKREIREELGLEIQDVRAFLQIKHAYTRFQVDLRSFRARVDGDSPRLNAASEGKWVPIQELDQYAFPAANKRLIEGLRIEL